jgi:hypothetical protein
MFVKHQQDGRSGIGKLLKKRKKKEYSGRERAQQYLNTI